LIYKNRLEKYKRRKTNRSETFLKKQESPERSRLQGTRKLQF